MQTVKEVVEALNFPVSKRPNMIVGVDGKTVRGVGCNVWREDRNVGIANVSDTYGLLKHGDCLSPILAALDGMDFDLKQHYLDHEGKRVMVKAVSEKGWSIGTLPNGTEDIVRLTLLLVNSYDRTTALKVNVGGYRQICSNGMVVEHPAFKGLNVNLKVVHSQNQTKNLDFVKLGNDVAKIYAAMELQAESWRKMKLTTFSKKAFEAIKLNVLAPVVGERNLDKVADLVTHGQGQDGSLTLWALYNGVTEHYTVAAEKSKTPVSAHGNLNRKATDFLERLTRWTSEHADQLVTVNA